MDDERGPDYDPKKYPVDAVDYDAPLSRVRGEMKYEETHCRDMLSFTLAVFIYNHVYMYM